MTTPTASALIEAFFRYTGIASQSDKDAATVPSSPGQWELARLLQEELEDIGLRDIHLDDHANLTALLPGTVTGVPTLGFAAHLDTVNVSLSPEIHPQVLRFDGADVLLNKERDIWLRVAEHPEILPYKGQDIVFTDGTSVLGADNKAAVAIIMTLLRELKGSTAPRGDIRVAFVPDEEIGLRGAKCLDLDRFKVDFAYTIDSCGLGEVVYETFNAASVSIEIKGITAHPMSAKGVLVNPLLIATDIINCFDRKDTPEHTDGKEGYFWVIGVQGNATRATVKLSIRDFDRASYEARKRYVHEVVALVAARHPRAKIACTVDDVYANIADSLGEDRRAIDLIYKGMEQLDITPKTLAMRGGTDGSALSARGLLTPNYFTGAHNFHSNMEFLPVPSWVKSYELTRTIVELATRKD